MGALELLAAAGALADEAIVVVEHASVDTMPEAVGRLDLIRSRKYGSTTVDFYETRAMSAGREEQT